MQGFDATVFEGVDPKRDATALRAALVEHGVVCIRFDRKLLDEELQAVAAMIGPIKDPLARGRDGKPLRYADRRQVIDSGFVMTEELRQQLGGGSLGGDDTRPGLFEFFHTDDSYTEQPASATVLHARALPRSGGGATSFIDMRSAYQLLDESTRKSLVALHAVHAYNNYDAFPPDAFGRGSARSARRRRASGGAGASGFGRARAVLRPGPRDAHREPSGGRRAPHCCSRYRITLRPRARGTRTSGSRTTC